LHLESRDVHVVCSGTDGCISLEDSLLAGAFAQHLKDMGAGLRNDEAEIAAGAWSKSTTRSGSRAATPTPKATR